MWIYVFPVLLWIRYFVAGGEGGREKEIDRVHNVGGTLFLTAFFGTEVVGF